MKERTMDALKLAEDYFVDVIEAEAHGKLVPSRTEELCYAVKGLKAIAVTKYKQHLKEESLKVVPVAVPTTQMVARDLANPVRMRHVQHVTA